MGDGKFRVFKKKSENVIDIKKYLYSLLIPTLLFLVAFIWKYNYIDQRDISLDEPFTIFHAQMSLAEIIRLPAKNEPNPPLFMMILHFWIKLFGISAHSVRIVPIFFNALTTVFLYFTGKRFFNLQSGLTASLLFIFSTYHFFFGADTRTYSMLSLATAGSLYYLMALQQNPEKKINLAGLIISNIVLVYGHYFGWFVIFIQFMVTFFYPGNRQFIKKSILAIATTTALYLPMFSILFKQFMISKKATWVTPPPASEFVQQLKWFINSGTGLRVLIYILIAGVIFTIVTKQKRGQIKDVALVLVWWLVPYTIMFFASSKIPMFTNRYILFNSVGFYLFIGVTVNYLFGKIKFISIAASLILLWMAYTRMFTGDFAPRKVKETTDFIRTKADSTSTIIIYAHWADWEFMYYYDQEIFKEVDKYENQLEKNRIYRAWGLDDTQLYLEENKPQKVIFYQNNTAAIDPQNSLFNYIDSAYTRTYSVPFDGGLVVSIFTKSKPDSVLMENNILTTPK